MISDFSPLDSLVQVDFAETRYFFHNLFFKLLWKLL